MSAATTSGCLRLRRERWNGCVEQGMEDNVPLYGVAISFLHVHRFGARSHQSMRTGLFLCRPQIVDLCLCIGLRGSARISPAYVLMTRRHSFGWVGTDRTPEDQMRIWDLGSERLPWKLSLLLRRLPLMDLIKVSTETMSPSMVIMICNFFIP